MCCILDIEVKIFVDDKTALVSLVPTAGTSPYPTLDGSLINLRLTL